MYPINFEGAMVVGKPENTKDEDCFSVYAKPIDFVRQGENGKDIPGRMWLEHWMPSKEDIEAINAGRGVWLQIHSGMSLVPLAILTLDEKGEPNV